MHEHVKSKKGWTIELLLAYTNIVMCFAMSDEESINIRDVFSETGLRLAQPDVNWICFTIAPDSFVEFRSVPNIPQSMLYYSFLKLSTFNLKSKTHLEKVRRWRGRALLRNVILFDQYTWGNLNA